VVLDGCGLGPVELRDRAGLTELQGRPTGLRLAVFEDACRGDRRLANASART
jgi:hypothetical protein